MFPQSDKRIIVTSGKNAYQGTLSATKNIDLSEDGYIKLSPPMCRVYSSEQSATFGLPYDLFSRTETTVKIHGPGDSTEMNLLAFGITGDGSFAGSNDGTRIVLWVGNSWFINADDGIYEYTGETASTTYTKRINNVLEFIEVFISRNTLVGRDIDNVNILRQYDSSYNASTDLTLPANFAITGAAFSNEMMGIITKQRKNQGNALFAVWDGSSAAANEVYSVEDPYILDVAAYKSSWVFLTSGGRLLYFNGGGFDELGRLPMYDLQHRIVDFTPTTTIVFGKLIHVDDDKIFVNCPSLPESSYSRKPYKPFYSGGIYCYDNKNGFYHTAAPSYSEYDTETVTMSSNIGTVSDAHFLETGDELYSNTTNNELTAQKTYYAIKLTSTTFKIAATYEDALASTAMTITDDSYSFFFVKRYDYGVESLKITDCGLVNHMKDYSAYETSGAFPLFMGAKVHPNNLGSARINTIQMAVPVMSNRGSFVLGKFDAGTFREASLEDDWNAVAITYSKLKPQDKIIVKAKVKDSEPIVVGDLTLYESTYTGEGVIWDGSGKYFSTSADLSEAEEGDEVYVFAGPGAGQSAHIKTINGNVDDGWEVILDEPLRGIVSGRKSCVSIDHFKKLGIITSNDTDGVKRLPLNKKGPSLEIKIELRGIGTKVSRVFPLKVVHKKAV